MKIIVKNLGGKKKVDVVDYRQVKHICRDAKLSTYQKVEKIAKRYHVNADAIRTYFTITGGVSDYDIMRLKGVV